MRIRLTMCAVAIATTFVAVGCHSQGGYNLPPAQQIAEPGPGVGGPGPGVLAPPMPPIAQASAMMPMQGGIGPGISAANTPMSQDVQVLFARPESMTVHWDISGSGSYDSQALIAPARQSFHQGGIYRLKISNIDGRAGVELYPTIEVGPSNYRTMAYLAHSAIPVQFTEEDFDQVLSGNFVTKVVYLPSPEHQALAVAGVETLVSTRLDPGTDPIIEAENKGAILAVVRLGNKDMETPGGSSSPAIMPATFTSPIGALGLGGGGIAGGNCGPGCNAGCCISNNMSVGNMYEPAGGLPPGIAGVTAPQYGMTMSGTPIGLPGPPHIPLGVPAGLQKHVVKNWTKQHIPQPTRKMQINVKQRPGISYPRPANAAWITEEMHHPTVNFSQHHFGQRPRVQCTPGCTPAGCAPGCPNAH